MQYPNNTQLKVERDVLLLSCGLKTFKFMGNANECP